MLCFQAMSLLPTPATRRSGQVPKTSQLLWPIQLMAAMAPMSPTFSSIANKLQTLAELTSLLVESINILFKSSSRLRSHLISTTQLSSTESNESFKPWHRHCPTVHSTLWADSVLSCLYDFQLFKEKII